MSKVIWITESPDLESHTFSQAVRHQSRRELTVVRALVEMRSLLPTALRLLALSLSACVSADENEAGRGVGLRLAILEGEDASAQTGVVHIEHALSSERCSGVLVRSQVVVTAAHCVFAPSGIALLEPSGFRVGMGSSTEQLEVASVSEVVWAGEAAGVTLAKAVEEGLDVAALVLARPAGPSMLQHEVAWDFAPTTASKLVLVGYGISSLETGASGRKLSGVANVIGWDRNYGILELNGAAGCLGDSGGPALSPDGQVAGIISSVSTRDDGTPCGGRTFLSTVLNPTVAAWLREVLEEPVPEADAGMQDEEEEHGEGGGTGGVDKPTPSSDDSDAPSASEGPVSSCALAAGASSGRPPAWASFALSFLAIIRFVRPRRGASTNER